jgi:hypothetical protein
MLHNINTKFVAAVMLASCLTIHAQRPLTYFIDWSCQRENVLNVHEDIEWGTKWPFNYGLEEVKHLARRARMTLEMARHNQDENAARAYNYLFRTNVNDDQAFYFTLCTERPDRSSSKH